MFFGSRLLVPDLWDLNSAARDSRRHRVGERGLLLRFNFAWLSVMGIGAKIDLGMRLVELLLGL
jgi:hypothetical protein